MSRRLEQEALAYFDECVSISTFEDSDFSSLEDLTSTNMLSIDCLDVERPSSGFSGVPNRAVDSCFFDTQVCLTFPVIRLCTCSLFLESSW